MNTAVQVSTPVTMAGTQQDSQLTLRPSPGDSSEHSSADLQLQALATDI